MGTKQQLQGRNASHETFFLFISACTPLSDSGFPVWKKPAHQTKLKKINNSYLLPLQYIKFHCTFLGIAHGWSRALVPPRNGLRKWIYVRPYAMPVWDLCQSPYFEIGEKSFYLLKDTTCISNSFK